MHTSMYPESLRINSVRYLSNNNMYTCLILVKNLVTLTLTKGRDLVDK